MLVRKNAYHIGNGIDKSTLTRVNPKPFLRHGNAELNTGLNREKRREHIGGSLLIGLRHVPTLCESGDYSFGS